MHRGLSLVCAVLAISALLAVRGASDEKASQLLQEAKEAVNHTAPIVAEYQVTITGEKETRITKHTDVCWGEGNAVRSSSEIAVTDQFPREIEQLYDPLLLQQRSFPGSKRETQTRYLGHETVEKTNYDVVDIHITFVPGETVTAKLYIGPDKHIDRLTGDYLIQLLPNKTGKTSLRYHIEGHLTALRKPVKFAERRSDAPPARSFEVPASKGPGDEPTRGRLLVLSPDGARLAIGDHDGSIYLYDVKSWNCQLTLPGKGDTVLALTFSPDSSQIMAVYRNGSLGVWDARTGKLTLSHKLPGEMLTAAAFAPDGKTLATTGPNLTVLVWDTASGQKIRALQAGIASISHLMFSPEGRQLASGDQGGAVRVWETNFWQEQYTLSTRTEPRPGHSLFALTFSPNSLRIAGASLDGTVRLWDARDGRFLHKLEDTRGIIRALAFTPDSKTLIAGDMYLQNSIEDSRQQSAVMVWDANTGQQLHTFTDHQAMTVLGVIVLPDGKFVAALDNRSRLNVWPLESR